MGHLLKVLAITLHLIVLNKFLWLSNALFTTWYKLVVFDFKFQFVFIHITLFFQQSFNCAFYHILIFKLTWHRTNFLSLEWETLILISKVILKRLTDISEVSICIHHLAYVGLFFKINYLSNLLVKIWLTKLVKIYYMY